MEGSDLHRSAAASETLDLDDSRKHAAMIERLSNLHHSRLQQSAARRSASGSSPAFESLQSFLARFSDRKRSIESDLDRCRGSLASDPDLKPELDKAAASIADLDALVAENSYFLPPYEVRSSLAAIAELKDSLEKVNAELMPRKKFSFNKKSSKKPNLIDPVKETKEKESEEVLDGERLNLAHRVSPGFTNMKGAVLVKRFRDSEDGDGDFTLADLTSCTVYIIGRLRALFIHRVRDCRIFVGPVLGSILIEDVDSCLFMLASHQIRIHQARATDFYLRVRSRSIIEDSNGVRFAPYQVYYEGIDEDLRGAGLEEETGNWANVDDFRWLRAVQSPNWCVVPEEDRLDTMVVTDLEKSSDANLSSQT